MHSFEADGDRMFTPDIIKARNLHPAVKQRIYHKVSDLTASKTLSEENDNTMLDSILNQSRFNTLTLNQLRIIVVPLQEYVQLCSYDQILL